MTTAPIAQSMLVLVPSRGRPESVAKVAKAWADTDAFADARLVFIIDSDDPKHDAYYQAHLDENNASGGGAVWLAVMDTWEPMVHKLNRIAAFAVNDKSNDWFAIAFAGDDHRPRTTGWAKRYVDQLRELGTGIVYGDDLIQHERLPTQWAMTADIVRTLGRMVPADVEHLYSDNAVLELGRRAGCLRYLPDVVIQHCHPVAGTAPVDEGYQRVNAPEQYAKDEAAFRAWQADPLGLARDVAMVQALREIK